MAIRRLFDRAQKEIGLLPFIGTVSGAGNASGSLGTVVLSTFGGSSTGEAVASGGLQTITLVSLGGSGSGGGTASGTFQTATVSAPTGNATGGAIGSSGLNTIALSGLGGSGSGAANVSGSLTSIALSGFTGSGSGGASASGTLQTITIVAPTGSATGGAVATSNFTTISTSGLAGLGAGGASVSGSLPTVSLSGLTGSGSGGATANGNLSSISIVAFSGSATGVVSGSAFGNLPTIILSSFSGTATGEGNAFGILPSVQILSAESVGSGGGAAFGGFGTVSVVAFTGNAVITVGGWGPTTLKETANATTSQLVVDYSPLFPQNVPFDIVIDSEIIVVRAIQIRLEHNDVILTVLRGQESTDPTKHLAGRSVVPVLTKKSFLTITDDKGHSSVAPVAATSITIGQTNGNSIFLVDPLTNDWRRFSAEAYTLPPILADGECADIFAHWNESMLETLYFMAIWSGSSPRQSFSYRNGVKIRNDGPTVRRYIGTIQRQGSLFTPNAYRVNLAAANNPTVRHEGFKVVRLNPTAANVAVHGLQSARDGSRVILSNISSTRAVLLRHSSTSALTNEKMLLPNAANLSLPPGGGVVCVYDVVSRAWRIVNNCFVRSPHGNDPNLVQNALEDGDGNLLAYFDGLTDVILYQGN